MVVAPHRVDAVAAIGLHDGSGAPGVPQHRPQQELVQAAGHAIDGGHCTHDSFCKPQRLEGAIHRQLLLCQELQVDRLLAVIG